ncbi:S8 family serine peptidase [Chiayiivirga flava]|uniref:Subtilisin family serine protease n=1 Tax=Chiayiivirga flava TaxID=659595 RepID=A0A7W8D1X7_9GAMM|nr:S8 family serine peptidase [Chiayiivirga flava]MBB5206488.1 subtilisin family serine protease [Chiayiivirga flava]
MPRTDPHAPPRSPRLPILLLLAGLTVAGGGPAAAQTAGVLRTPVPQISGRDAATVTVDEALSRRLRAGGAQDFAIELRERADLSAAAGMDWDARGRHVFEQLRATAERSQASLRRALDAAGTAYEAHWIKNVILVRGGDAATLQLAAAHPGVARIRPLPDAAPILPEPGSAKAAPAKAGVADNIAWIGADQVWAQGTRGNGVTVGVIDTGALHTHAALRRQYRGWNGGDYQHDYNWFEPGGASGVPHSVDAHGSHVLGTIAGDDHAEDPEQRARIGVAPGAQWIACMGFTTSGGSDFNLLSCGEFMLAPTRTDGSEPRPELRPQVVNNSWSEGNCNGETSPFYADMVDAWVAAGIFPVFAAGNAFTCFLPEPAGLSTVSAPASLAAAFAVGSSGNHDGTYAAHSLWGPTTAVSPGLPLLPDPAGFPQMKPQVVAPGVDIVSAYDGDDAAYGTMTGTSMSAPHIAGLVALMLDAGDCLVGDYATLGTLIMRTARPMPYASGGDPAPGPGDVPNYATGWGEIDAPAAVAAAGATCGPRGVVAGTVTDAAGAPVAGATVELSAAPEPRVYTVHTDTDGSYSRRVLEDTDGGYTVRVTAYGYLPSEEAGVVVREGQTTPFDVRLATAPLHKVSGRVRDAATGWPLHARVRIAGYPGGAVWTDPVSGQYSVRLPAGTAYRLDVDSDIPGYLPQTRELPDVATGGTQDVALPADTVACVAPGYAFAQSVAAEDFEAADGAPPAGWNATSAGIGWRFGTHAQLQSPDWNLAARDGRFAASIDPFPPEGEINDARIDYLDSPPIDLSGAVAPVLRFASYHWTFNGRNGPGGGRVLASDDGGATWMPLGMPAMNEDAFGPWREEAFDLSAHAGGTVRLRFHYDDGSDDEFDSINPGWAIDDVRIDAQCLPPAHGGLVVGHVRDANTGNGLDGASVSIAGAPPQATRTSDDPGVGSGFFAGWAPSGSAALAATRGTQPVGYGEAAGNVAVATGGTVATTLALPAGRLRTYPAGGPSVTVELGQTASVPFTLRNSGTLPLRYGLEGEHRVEHFEDGVPPSGWTATDNGQGCAWSPNAIGNGAGGDGIAAEVYLYPCWGATRLDNSLVLPPVDLSQSDSASIGFFLSHFVGASADPRFDVEASTDGGASWTAVYTETADTGARDPFNLVEQDLSAYAGQPDLRLRLRYRALPPWGFVQVDQVHVFRSLGQDGPLAVAPVAGTLAPDAGIDTTALFDATGVAQPGIYTVPIRIGEDTPYVHPYGELHGTMTVTAPPSYGAVAGTVRSLGRCDAAPQALAQFDLAIEDAHGGQHLARTDADGHYRYWLDAALGPFTLTAQADGHVLQTRDVGIVAGEDIAADFDLRPLLPCLATAPDALTFALDAGGNAQLPLDLLNLGAAAGDYSARIGGDPAVPSALRLSQSVSPEPEQFVAFGCVNTGDGFMLESHWYRVYPLSEQGLAGDRLFVDGVRFGADSAFSGAGVQTVTVRVHALDGEFVRANLALLGETTVDVADMPLQLLSARFDPPIEVALDTVLVAEISVPDGSDTFSTFYPAGNTAGDTAPTYYSADACGSPEPVPYADLGLEWIATLIDLDIRASDACGPTATPVTWLDVTPVVGNVAGDGEQTLAVRADAGALATGTHDAAVCVAGPMVGGGLGVVPVRANVGTAGDGPVFADGFE